MIDLSKNKKILNEMLPMLRNFRYGSCCKSLREKQLIKGLSDIFELLEITYDDSKLKKKPYKYYNALNKIINKDTTLNEKDKIKYTKLMIL